MLAGGAEQETVEAYAHGRLSARPGKPGQPAPTRGVYRLGLDGRRDGLLFVPGGYHAARPAPFVLMLHGAGGSAAHGLHPLQSLAEERGIVLLAPDSRGNTWDVLLGGLGPDVAFIDQALAYAFDRCAIDPARVAIEGFSDGASYALSLGLANGCLFTHIIAFAPGFMAPPGQEDSPRFFISHGTRDNVLPIVRCSRRVVPALEDAGFDVTYREFDGGHTVPLDIACEAAEWFLGEESRG